MNRYRFRILLVVLLLTALILSTALAEQFTIDGEFVLDGAIGIDGGDNIDLDGDLLLETLPGQLEIEKIIGASTFPEKSGVTTNTGSVEINATNFPDKAFRKYVKEAFDEDWDGWLSDSEIAEVVDISFMAVSVGCTSLKGIELFYNLQSIDCMDCNLTSLDVSRNTELVSLNCESNGLETLDISGNTKLEYLSATGNKLTRIDIGNCPVLLDAVRNLSYTLNDDEATWIDDDDCQFINIDADTMLTAGSDMLYEGRQVTVKLAAESVKLGVKETFKLSPTVTPSGKADSVRFKSSNAKVAKVDAKTGKITAKEKGKATIGAIYNGRAIATCKVIVKKAPGKVKLSKTKGKMLVGDTYRLKATLSRGTASVIKWSSSNKKVATVDQTGLITAVGKGVTTITAKTFNGKKAKCKVTVKSAVGTSGIELSGYFKKNIHDAAKKIGGLTYKKGDGEDGIGDIYENKKLVLKGWNQISIIGLKQSSDYMLLGCKVGMSRASIRAKMKGYIPESDDDYEDMEYIIEEGDGYPKCLFYVLYNENGYAQYIEYGIWS